MASQGDDCYFYYYSSCSKGDSCPFRHQPAALGNEITCQLWLQGKCVRKICKYRHMQLEKYRPEIPCYWENQNNGCLKPHCPFLHIKPRSFGSSAPPPGIVLPSQPPQQADLGIIQQAPPPHTAPPRLSNSIAPLLSTNVPTQVLATRAPIPNAPNIPPIPLLDPGLPNRIATNPVDVSKFVQNALPVAGIADSSFREQLRKFKEMFSNQQGSPKKDVKKKRSRGNDKKGDVSDLEFEKLMDEHDARQRKEKSGKKDRRDRKDNKRGSKQRELKQRSKLEKEKRKQRHKKEKKERREKDGKDEATLISSDEFEVVEDTPENSNDVESNAVEDSVQVTERREDSKSAEGNAEKEDANGDERKEGDGLGFRIKSYEEILREKALRKMLERRQQLKDKLTDEKSSDGKSVQGNSEADTGKDVARLNEAVAKSSTAIKSQVIQPDTGREQRVNVPASPGKAEIRSKVVLIGNEAATGKEADGSAKLKRAAKFNDDNDSPKKVKVVRKVAVTTKALIDEKQSEPNRKGRDKKGLEIYKPPIRSVVAERPTEVTGSEATELNSVKDGNVVRLNRVSKPNDQEKPAGGQDASKPKESVPESPLKVKSFEEIMEEKRARKQQTSEGSRQNIRPLMESKCYNPKMSTIRGGQPAQLARKVNVRAVPSEAKAERMAKAEAYRHSLESVVKNKNVKEQSSGSSLHHAASRGSSKDHKHHAKKDSGDRGERKPRILKRPNSREGTKREHASKLSPKDRDGLSAKMRRLDGKESSRKPHVKRIKPNLQSSFSSKRPSGRDEVKKIFMKDDSKKLTDDELLEDLADDIDLDIGVEVEDAPLKTLDDSPTTTTTIGENVTRTAEEVDRNEDVKRREGVNYEEDLKNEHDDDDDLLRELGDDGDSKDGKDDNNADEPESAPLEDIQEAVNAELKKKSDLLLSDDELERELQNGDFPSLDDGEEIDDDDLLLELEEMINS